jgi:hypothetical protein
MPATVTCISLRLFMNSANFILRLLEEGRVRHPQDRHIVVHILSEARLLASPFAAT